MKSGALKAEPLTTDDQAYAATKSVERQKEPAESSSVRPIPIQSEADYLYVHGHHRPDWE